MATEWVMLAYRLPREPSTPRIALWRRLKKLGVAQVVDGLVALPGDRRTREQLEWAAQEVTQAGGFASLWTAKAASAGDERALRERMTKAVSDDYELVIAAANAADSKDPAARRRALKQLRRTQNAIELRDYFPTPKRAEARDAVERLAQTVEVAQ
ncbi:MAG TPA: Chromate resistance protein ChrB [Gaiellaceae bacterium]|nr:Chromate resistance protein ChrB [Gaiellaceae bacterium]